AALVVIVTDVRLVHLTRPKSRDQKPVESALAHQTADPRPAPITLSQRQDWRLHWDIGHDVSFRSSRPCTRMRLPHKRDVTGLLLCIWAGHMYRHGRACWSESYARSASRRLRSVLDRRIGIFAEPNQEQTGQGKGSLIDREDLRIGVEPVEGAPA